MGGLFFMTKADSFIKTLGFKGLNDLYQLIVDKRIEDTKTNKYKHLVEERIKLFTDRKVPSSYNKSFKKYYKTYQSYRYKTDIKFKLSRNISRQIRRTLKIYKKSKHWEELLGYTCCDLKNHLQKTMPKGYTWQDFLDGKLHIDHIIPISVFNFTKPEHIDFKRCWALSNLQLLPARENIIKSNKLSQPFQPALKL